LNCDVLVIGCGVVGCAIAYELSAAGLSVVGIDAGDPAAGSTGAALGVLVGISSRQAGGETVQLRLKSLELFDPLIARLEEDLGRSLPVNRRGILKLLREEEVEAWQETLAARRQAGYRLDLLSPAEVGSLQPGLRSDLAGAIYSPQDRQVQPKLLTQALLEAAQRKGSRFFFHQPVQKIQRSSDPPFRLQTVYTPALTLSAGHVILAAGLGSSPLAKELGLQVPLQAVKGQALRVKAPGIPLGPVVTDADLHLVPLGDGSLWVGATVEFQAPHPSRRCWRYKICWPAPSDSARLWPKQLCWIIGPAIGLDRWDSAPPSWVGLLATPICSLPPAIIAMECCWPRSAPPSCGTWY
jgi:glycine/D-amino acid oxidase-like deaminating enzyme